MVPLFYPSHSCLASICSVMKGSERRDSWSAASCFLVLFLFLKQLLLELLLQLPADASAAAAHGGCSSSSSRAEEGIRQLPSIPRPPAHPTPFSSLVLPIELLLQVRELEARASQCPCSLCCCRHHLLAAASCKKSSSSCCM